MILLRSMLMVVGMLVAELGKREERHWIEAVAIEFRIKTGVGMRARGFEVNNVQYFGCEDNVCVCMMKERLTEVEQQERTMGESLSSRF